MVIRVLNDRSVVKDTDPYGTQNENQVTTLNFVIPEEYASFNKKIVFITPNGVYWDLITNDTYIIKNNVTKYRNVSAYVWLVDVENQVDFRTKIFYIDFNQNTNPDNFIPSSEEISGYDTMIAELNELIQEVEDLGALHYEIVEELPTEDIDPTAVYLILREDSEPNNIYDEWMYIESAWEKIGSTDVDLQPLQKEIDEINEMLFTHTTAESVNQEVSLNGNPNLEMNITELDGRTEQDTTNGYQLFSTTLEQGTINSSSGQNTSSDTIIRSVDFCDIEPSTEYTIDISTRKSVGLRYYKENGEFISSVNAAATPRTFTSVENAYKIRFIFANTTDTTAKVTLEKGSSVHEWEEYTGGIASPNPSYPQNIDVVTGTQDVVVSGKNYFNVTDYSNISIVSNVSATSTKTQNSFSVTTNNQYYSGVYISKSDFNSYVDNFDNDKTYVVSADIDIDQSTTFQFGSTTAPFQSITAGKQRISVQTKLNNAFVFYNIAEKVVAFTISNIQVSELADTTYEPYYKLTKQVHLGEIELAKIGTYKDKIYPSGGKWYLHKEVGKVVYDGSNDENWYINGSVHYISITDKIKQNLLVFSNMYKYSQSSWQQINNNEITSQDGNSYIFIKDNAYDSTEDYNTFLATHNVIVYYVLATPTDTEITGTLKEELDALQKLQQLNGKTIVSIEGDLAADFKLVYENDSISDLNTRVGNIEANYVKDTDYATDSKYGIIKTGYGLQLSNGNTYATTFTYQQYSSAGNGTFVGKGTLENVLNEVVGDINTLLDTINGEVI